jgi:hypothetical protein
MSAAVEPAAAGQHQRSQAAAALDDDFRFVRQTKTVD